MATITLGVAIILLGVADAVLIRTGFPVGPTHDSIILIVAGCLFATFGFVKRYARDDIRIPFLLSGVSVGIWSMAVTEIVARLIVENWAFVLAFALAQGPIVKIFIYKTYGGWVRSTVVNHMKDVGSLNEHKTRIARRLVSQLPIEESAIYAIQASAITTALFINEFGFTVNSATTAAFLCATATGTLFYTFHSSVEEVRGPFAKTRRTSFRRCCDGHRGC